MGNCSCDNCFGFNVYISFIISIIPCFFMNLGSISENLDVEKRIAISPEMAKKYINLGFNLSLSKNYASHLGFTDADYTNLGAKLCDNDEEVIQNSMIITQLGLPNEKNLSLFNVKIF